MNRSNKFIILLIINLTLSLLGMMCTSAQAAACSATTSPYLLDCDPSNVTFTGSLVVNQGVKLTGAGALNVQSGNFTNNGFILSTNTVAFSVNNGTGTGVAIPSGQTINNFVNTGTITGVIGVWNNLQGKITTLTNTGTIDGGINNDASVHTNFFGMFDPFITTLNNLQGASIGQPLKYSGLLGKF